MIRLLGRVEDEMHFDDMNAIQRRLHNCALVLGADGDEYGFEQLQRDAIAEIQVLRELLGRCGGDNCMGRRGDDVTNWVTEHAADARVAAERARTAAALAACAIAQQCIKAAYEDQWASFDALSDDFDDALAAVAEAGGPNVRAKRTTEAKDDR